MRIDPGAGKLPAAVDAGERAAADDGVLHPAPRSIGVRAARRVRHVRASRLRARRRLQRSRTSSPSPRPSATTGGSSGIDGPLFLGADTHALSEPALASALEVLAANGVDVMIDDGDGYTPTPVVSHAILTYNRGRTSGLADGIVVTPSHNPPRRRRLQVQPAQRRAGRHPGHRLDSGPRQRAARPTSLRGVKRMPFERARARRDHPPPRLHGRVRRRPRATSSTWTRSAAPGLKLGVDPARRRRRALLGRDRRALSTSPLTVVSDDVDPTFRFMTVDWDGKIRMDCSSPYAMQRLIALQGPLRRRLGVRHRSRPSRHRHARAPAC